MNPYLNSPPSPPRYFYPRSDVDDEEGTNQSSGLYTLEKARSMGQRKRIRSSSYQSRGEQPVDSPRFVNGNVGSRQKERGQCFFFFLSSTSTLNFSFSLSPVKYRGHVQRRRGRSSCTATKLLFLPLTLTKYVFKFRLTRTRKDTHLVPRQEHPTSHHRLQSRGCPSRGTFLILPQSLVG